MEVVEEVAFRRLDSRTAVLLLETADESGRIRITHEKIAFDLGSSREVISRILKDFEREGLVALSRGTITIRDREGLKRKGE